MKRSKFTEEQIAFGLKRQELASFDEVCRKIGISEATFYVWKKYSGLGPSALRPLRQLEEENRKLKQLVADLSLEECDGAVNHHVPVLIEPFALKSMVENSLLSKQVPRCGRQYVRPLTNTLRMVAEKRTLRGSYIGSAVPSRDIPRYIALPAGPAAGEPADGRAADAGRHRPRLRPAGVLRGHAGRGVLAMMPTVRPNARQLHG